MNAVLTRVRADVSAFLFGALICLLAAMWISPGGEADWIWEIYDEHNPVAVGRVERVAHDGQAIEFDLYTTKARKCVFGQAATYAIAENSREHMLLQRLDRPATGVNHPIGVEIRNGRWKAWPTAGARTVEFWVTYRCSTRDVLTRVVEIAL